MKTTIRSLGFAAAFALSASIACAQSATILTGATATGAGAALAGYTAPAFKTYQVYGSTASGTGTLTISVEGSNTGAHWDTIGTVTLSLTSTPTSGGFTSGDRYSRVRGNVTTISGTGASAGVVMGY